MATATKKPRTARAPRTTTAGGRSAPSEFRFFEDNAGEHHWVIAAKNGTILAQSRPFATLAAAEAGAAAVRDGAATATARAPAVRQGFARVRMTGTQTIGERLRHNRHFPRLCSSCGAPMACQEDTCWHCAARWGQEPRAPPGRLRLVAAPPAAPVSTAERSVAAARGGTGVRLAPESARAGQHRRRRRAPSVPSHRGRRPPRVGASHAGGLLPTDVGHRRPPKIGLNAMLNIFKRPSRSSVATTAVSDRIPPFDEFSAQAAENETRRQASDAQRRQEVSENEARRVESEERARLQAVENEASRRASEDQARLQAVENEASRKAADVRDRAQSAQNEARHQADLGRPGA